MNDETQVEFNNIYEKQQYPDEIVRHEFEDESELGYFDALLTGIKQTPLAVSIRQTLGNDLENPSTYTPKDEVEFSNLFKEVGYNKGALFRVLNNASSLDEVKANIKLYNDDLLDAYRLSKNHWTTQVASSVLGSLASPQDVALMAYNPAYGASKLARIGTNIAYNVGTGVASNYVQSKLLGVEQNIESDVLGLAMMSAGFNGLGVAGDALAKTGRKVAKQHDDIASGNVPTPSQHKGGKVARKVNEALETINKKFFKDIEVKEKLLRDYDDSDKVKELVHNFFNYQQGTRVKDGSFATRLTTGETAMDLKNAYLKADYGIEDLGTVAWKEATDLNIPDKVFNEYVQLKAHGKDVSSLEQVYPELKVAKKTNSFVEEVRKHYDLRGQELVDNKIIDGVARGDSYMPRAINRFKLADKIGEIGSVSLTYARVRRCLKEGITMSPERMAIFRDIYDLEVLSKVKEDQTDYVIQFDEWFDIELNKASKGYVDQGIHKNESSLNDPDDGTTFSFEKHRRPWDWTYRDADGFSMLDVSEDVVTALKKYNQRTQGELIASIVYNTNYKGLKDKINEAKLEIITIDNNNETRGDAFEREMTASLRRLYGMNIDPKKNIEAGRLEALSEVLRNLTFGAYSTYMGLLNYAEMTNAVKAYGASTVIKAIPYARELADRWDKGEFNLDDIRALENLVTGGEVRALIGKAETVANVSRQYSGIDKWMQGIVTGSRLFAQYSPGSLLLRESQRSIVSTVQETFLSELIRKSHGTDIKGRGFLRDIDVKRAGVSEKKLNSLMRTLKESTALKADGKIDISKLKNTLQDNPEALYTLRKLDEFVANEAIQRRGIDDIFSWEIHSNPFLSLVTQFKTFALQSYNKRLVQLGHRWEEEGASELVSTLAISTALSGIVNLGITGIRTLGMSEEDRDAYIERALGIEDFDITRPTDLLQAFLETGIYRNPYSASLMLALNFVGVGTGLKTTAGTSGYGEDNSFISSVNLGQTVTDNLPAVRFLQNIINGSLGLANLAMDGLDIGDDYTRAQKTATAKQLMTGISSFPQVPVLTNVFKGFVGDKLEDYKINY